MSGRAFEAAGIRSFVFAEGDGPPVVCLHGVPSRSFLYRKVLSLLAGRSIAFYFSGMGLAQRPTNFDYSWSGRAGWTAVRRLAGEKARTSAPGRGIANGCSRHRRPRRFK
jgi:pimeloyl-ACP methyl ester carboxylesterase